MRIKKIHIHKFWQAIGVIYLIGALVVSQWDVDLSFDFIKVGVLMVIASELVQIEVILERDD